LAGGLGTRLRALFPDTPKPLAPINGRPFIDLLISNLVKQGLTDLNILTCYKASEVEESVLSLDQPNVRLTFWREHKPLGTGGALRAVVKNMDCAEVLVMNGDTYFPIDYWKLIKFHEQCGSRCTIALKQSTLNDRYMILDKDARGVISRPRINKHGGTYLNGGVYVLNVKEFLMQTPCSNFSFEAQFLQPMLSTSRVFGLEFSTLFIDIGVPEDYLKLRTLLGQ
jgi:D-glycero-alpha-D-manno-heptose 1-phosphate guanylyltransferase